MKDKPNWLGPVVNAIGRDTGVHHVTVLHDDWCDHLTAHGPCNCNPTISHVSHKELRERQLRSN